mmetsp:Transcript_89461/g.251982  ORF Transcript_89461/g.251982 Transcript_89461/m.251982 type:complete len:219 (+) Transcript_89461:10-666(+)
MHVRRKITQKGLNDRAASRVRPFESKASAGKAGHGNTRKHKRPGNQGIVERAFGGTYDDGDADRCTSNAKSRKRASTIEPLHACDHLQLSPFSHLPTLKYGHGFSSIGLPPPCDHLQLSPFSHLPTLKNGQGFPSAMLPPTAWRHLQLSPFSHFPRTKYGQSPMPAVLPLAPELAPKKTIVGPTTSCCHLHAAPFSHLPIAKKGHASPLTKNLPPPRL